MEYSEYLSTDYWKRLRINTLERDGFRCKRCGSEENLCVHHITYENVFNENLEDLITLCRKCHYIIHKSDNTNGYTYFNVDTERQQKIEEYINDFENIDEELLKTDYLENINMLIKTNNYIEFDDFLSIVENINKSFKNKFNNHILNYFCLKKLNLVLITCWKSDMIEKYGFPKDGTIVISRETYILEKPIFNQVRYYLDLSVDFDIREAFNYDT